MKRPYGYVRSRPMSKREFQFWTKMYIGALAIIMVSFTLLTLAHALNSV